MPTNTYAPCAACTGSRCTYECSRCYRDGGPFGIGGCSDILCCNESSDADKPFKQLGCTKFVAQGMDCVTGDDGVDAEMAAFAIQVDMPEGVDLCPLAYCCCCNYSCYTKFPDNCNGGACEAELCMIFCLRAKRECEFTMFPFQACCRCSGSEACCDFQRPEGEDSTLCSCGTIGEAACLCEFKDSLSTVFRWCYDEEGCFCMQVRCQSLCCVQQAAFPTTNDVPCAIALCGVYCYGQDAVNAVSDEKSTKGLEPSSST